MTLVNFKHRPVGRNFNNLLDDLFLEFPSIKSNEWVAGSNAQAAPVNVRETDNSYELEVIAAGFEKGDFSIQLENDLLTITAERKSEKEDKTGKYLRQEYKFRSFKRSFTVKENIDAEGIAAQYVNGVLLLNLPKKTEVRASAKNITVH